MTDAVTASAPPREQRAVEVVINDTRYRFDQHVVTGRQIKAKADIPDADSLYLRRPGSSEPIADGEEVMLHDGDEFFSRPPSNVS
jgi:hypothetical protein